jgi:transcriptional regulator of arginine metabolism
MKNKRARLQLIRDLIRHNVVGSQDDLAKLLSEEGVVVTQATLSRDLKTLKTSKIATDNGGYMYIIPDANELQDSMLKSGNAPLAGSSSVGFVSLAFSGNFAVIKTRNGYASGLAYDIDMAQPYEIIGTIAGANTVFAVLREGVTHEQAAEMLSKFIPKAGES